MVRFVVYVFLFVLMEFGGIFGIFMLFIVVYGILVFRVEVFFGEVFGIFWVFSGEVELMDVWL